MRHNTLGAMVQMLRRELHVAESPSLGRNVRDAHCQALRSAQERLYQAWDWPFKKIYRDKPGVMGERYYAPPADLDLENIREVRVLVTNLWYPCIRGIDTTNYNVVNSDKGIGRDWIRNWDLYNDPDDGGDMIEVWPIPLTTGYSLMRFFGVKKLAPLVMDADKADLDDYAIVLSAAADLSPARERVAAQAKADRYVFSLARNLNNSRTFISGGGEDHHEESYRPPQIIIAQ